MAGHLSLFLLIASSCGNGENEISQRVIGLEQLTLIVPPDSSGLRPFFLDRFEVTRRLFAEYRLSNLEPKHECLPVVGISPREAIAFAAWRGMRLPWLKEWEATIGIFPNGDGSFPWGITFDLANWDELKGNTAELGLGHLTPVGVFDLGSTRMSGVLDLVGNAAEWVVKPPDPQIEVSPSRLELFFLKRFTNQICGNFYTDQVGDVIDLAMFHHVIGPTLSVGRKWKFNHQAGLVFLRKMLEAIRFSDQTRLKQAITPQWRGVSSICFTSPLYPLSWLNSLSSNATKVNKLISLCFVAHELKREITLPLADNNGLEVAGHFALSLPEWETVKFPFAAVGWHYMSSMEYVGDGEIPGRVSGRKGWDSSSSTIGFRCATYPNSLLDWLARPDGPDLTGKAKDKVAAFLQKYRRVFIDHALKLPKSDRAMIIIQMLQL